MTPKIFTIGGAVFDLFVKTGDQGIMEFTTPDASKKWLCMPHGGKLKVTEVIEAFGGGACNTAVGFSRMGFDATCVAKVGMPYGDRVIDNLKKEAVHTDFVSQTKKDKTSFSTIISSFDGDRTVLGYPGANRFFTANDLPLAELAKADWIFLNHLTEKDSKIPATLLELLKKNPKIKLAWNPGHEQISQGVKKWSKLLARTEVLFLNKEEAAEFTRKPYELAGIRRDHPLRHLYHSRRFLPPYADDVTEIMLELLKHGVKRVVITDAQNGAQASDGKKLYFCPVADCKRVDTLGAGDAFSTGCTSALIIGKDLKDALVYGTLNANSVVSQYGAQKGLLTAKGMQEALERKIVQATATGLMI